MSDFDEIGVSRPNRVAVTLWTGHELTERDLHQLKGNPLYHVHPAYRAGVDRLHETAHHVRQMERIQAHIERRRGQL